MLGPSSGFDPRQTHLSQDPHLAYLLQQRGQTPLAMEAEDPHYLSLQRAMLAAAAGEGNLGATMGRRCGEAAGAMDGWDEALRGVGKAQSMRAVSTFSEENELLRHAFQSMRRYHHHHHHHHHAQAEAQALRDGCHAYHSSTPVFHGGMGSFGLYSHGAMAAAPPHQAWLPPHQFAAHPPSLPFDLYGEEERLGRRVEREARHPGRHQSSMDAEVAAGEGKIDGARSQSMREMGQCWACGQRLWAAGGGSGAWGTAAPAWGGARKPDCHPCNVEAQCQARHSRARSSAPPACPPPSSSSSSSAACSHSAVAAAVPPLAPPPAAAATGCKPSSAHKKKKARLIQLCKQFLGLPIH